MRGVFLYLLVLWLCNLAGLFRFLRRLEAPAPPCSASLARPKVGVFFPLRGTDPRLAEAIRSVLEQDYDNFEVHLIVDSADDPAYPIARREAANDPRIRLTLLTQRRRNCSLVCSALLQVLDQMHESVELIAFGAGDAVLPQGWIQRLVDAMAKPGVGTTIGSRWYSPVASSWGSIVRHLWFAAATPASAFVSSPWATGMVLRRTDIQRAGLKERWGRALGDDSPVVAALSKLGLGCEYLAEQFVVIREPIDLGACFSFLRRQLVSTRLHHPFWPLMLLHGISDLVALFAPLLVAAFGLWLGDFSRLWVLAFYLAYVLGQIFILSLLSRRIAGRLRRAGQVHLGQVVPDDAVFSLPPGQRWKLLLAIPLAQLVSVAAMFSAVFARQVIWRGVTYRIRGPWSIEIVDEKPSI